MPKKPRELNLNSISILIEPTRKGEADSRERLFAELRGYLETVVERNADRRIRQKAGTSDIVQASFIRIVEKFNQFQGSSSGELKAWIKTIVSNEIKSIDRSFNTAKRDVARERTISPTASNAMGIDPKDGNLTPSSRALKSEQLRKVHDILDQLASDDAEVIRLRNFEFLSFREIGKRMDRSEQAASQLWYRAILKFEEKMGTSGESGNIE